VRLLRVLSVLAFLGAVALADDPYKGPLERARVGQWVTYQLPNEMRMRQSIAKVDGRKISIKNEMWIKGQALPANETPIDLDKRSEALEKAAKAEAGSKVEEGKLEINGHELACHIQTQGNVKTWTCDDVPITGIVRQELDGHPTLEMTGYGNSSDEDRLKK
jgi:hypothetical protein